MSMALNNIDIVVIVVSIISIVSVGMLVSRKRGESTRSYFIASGKLPWWLIGTSVVATSVSSEQIVGTIGAAYKHGMGIANWEWFTLPYYTLTILFFIPIYLKNRITTVGEFYSKRFGPLCADIYSWTMLIAYILVFTVPVLYGGSLAFSELTGVPFTIVIWLIVIMVGAYTIKGGLLSVVWTDMLQCSFLVGGGLILFVLALKHIPGGWGAMVEANPERFHLYHPPSDSMTPFLGLIFISFNLSIFYQATNQVMIQRVLGARSTWDGIMGTIFAGFINFLRPCVTCFLGFVVYYWIFIMKKAPPLDVPDKTFSFALRTFAPEWGIRGIILTGFLAAVMSTIGALVNSISTIFALDVYKKFICKNSNDKTIVLAGRIAAALGLIIAALLAPMVEQFGGIFRYFQTAVTYLATPFSTVFFLGILWKRMNYPGALFGMIAGIIITILLVVILNILNISLHWTYIGFIVQFLIVIGIVVVSLVTQAPSEPECQPFVWRKSLLSQYNTDGAFIPWYKTIKLWYFIFAIIWFFLYWKFW